MWNQNSTGSFSLGGRGYQQHPHGIIGQSSFGQQVPAPTASSSTSSPFLMDDPSKFVGLGGMVLVNHQSPAGASASGAGVGRRSLSNKVPEITSVLDLPIPDDLASIAKQLEDYMNAQKMHLLEVGQILQSRKEKENPFNLVQEQIRNLRMEFHELEVGVQKMEAGYVYMRKEVERLEKPLMENVKFCAITKDRDYTFKVGIEIFCDQLKSHNKKMAFLDVEITKAEALLATSLSHQTEPTMTLGDILQTLETTKDSITFLAAEVQVITEALNKLCSQLYGRKMTMAELLKLIKKNVKPELHF